MPGAGCRVPMTLSHPAAVLLLRRLGLPMTAMVIGSVVPDVPLFMRWSDGYALTHSLVGVPTVDVAATMVLLAIWFTVARDALIEPRIDESAERVRVAYLNLSNAEFNYSSTLAPFSVLEIEGDDDDDDDDEEPLDEDAEYNQLSLMVRRDYRLTSAAALLTAGRSAYGQVWPEDSAEAAVEDVQDVGRAIYQIIHARGLEGLDEAEGIEATAGVMLTIGKEQLITETELVRAMDDPGELFVVDGHVIYSQTDIWA